MELTVTPQKSTNHPSSKNLLEAGIFPLFDPSKFKAKSEDNRNKAVFVKGKMYLVQSNLVIRNKLVPLEPFSLSPSSTVFWYILLLLIVFNYYRAV